MTWPSVMRWMAGRTLPRIAHVPVVIAYDGEELQQMAAAGDGEGDRLTAEELQRLRRRIEAEAQRAFRELIGARCEVTADGTCDVIDVEFAQSAAQVAAGEEG